MIAAPQAAVKNYCFDKWLDQIVNFTYPESYRKLFLADNSDNNRNYKDLIKRGIACEYIKSKNRGIIERMALSHEACRQYALKYNFDFLLHLETDIFPDDIDIIERLLFHRKPIVSCIYDSLTGVDRKMIVQLIENTDAEHFHTAFFLDDIDGEVLFADGTLKRVYHAGLGCTLISRKVFKKVRFRHYPNMNLHPDSIFATDLFDNGIDVWCDTGAWCRHENQPWGEYGIDFW